MTTPVFRRQRADEDIEQAQAFYGDKSVTVEDAFIDEIEATMARIARDPHLGRSAKRFTSCPGLRYYRLARFPYLMFYLDLGDRCEVVRVLYVHMDLPPKFQDL